MCALSISAEIVLRLLNSRNRSGHSEADRIHGSFPRKLELLLRAQRNCVVVVAHIEIGNDAEHPLLLLRLDLIFRHFDPCGDDTHFSDSRCKGHGDLRDRVALPRPQDSVGPLRREAHGRNCELEGTGSDVCKRELPIVARKHFLHRGLIFP